MGIYVNIDGVNKAVTQPSVNIDGTWKTVSDVYNNINGVWKTSYRNYTPFTITISNRNMIGYSNTITNLVIPKSFIDNGTEYKVVGIGNRAFFNCTSLTSITIPSSVTSIGSYQVFGRSMSLNSITVDSTNTSFRSINGILFDKNKSTIICFPAGKSDTSYNIPDTVTKVGNYAFDNCISLASINIPDSVTTIGTDAFSTCRLLTSINIPDSVTTIGARAFNFCNNLSSIIIPNKVTTIDYGVFYGCTSLTSVIIPSSVRSIVNYAFYNCTSLTTVYYTGTEEQWNAITIGTNNTPLTNATKVYNHVA